MLSEELKRLVHQRQIKGRTIVFLSGLPGTGKTTVAALLKARLGGTVVPEFLDPVPAWVINTRPESSHAERLAAQHWTLDQHAKKNALLGQMNGRAAVVDRTWIDTLIYSYAYGVETFQATVRAAELYPWSDGHFFVLSARSTVVRKRMIEKEAITADAWDTTWKSYIAALAAASAVVASELSLSVVDTSCSDPSSVCELILKTIEK
jgi:hypothetical protein